MFNMMCESLKSQQKPDGSYPRILELPLYLESLQKVGGGQLVSVDAGLEKVAKCGSSYGRFMECQSGSDIFIRIDCHKWFCPVCGGKDGREVQKRFRESLEQFEGALGKGFMDRYYFRQFVFTVPLELREKFQSKRGCSNLMKAVSRLINKPEWAYPDKTRQTRKNPFAGQMFFQTFHAMGEQGVYEFNPHVNIEIPTDRHENAMLSKELLDDLKDAWLLVLKGYGYKGTARNVNYQYKYQPGQMIHALHYMNKPMGCENGAWVMSQLIEDERWDLIEFYTVELKGLHQRKMFNKGKVRDMENESDDVKRGLNDVEEILRREGVLKDGQKPYYKFQGIISKTEMFMQFHPMTGLIPVGDGVYVQVNKKQGKKK